MDVYTLLQRCISTNAETFFNITGLNLKQILKETIYHLQLSIPSTYHYVFLHNKRLHTGNGAGGLIIGGGPPPGAFWN